MEFDVVVDQVTGRVRAVQMMSANFEDERGLSAIAAIIASGSFQCSFEADGEAVRFSASGVTKASETQIDKEYQDEV